MAPRLPMPSPHSDPVVAKLRDLEQRMQTMERFATAIPRGFRLVTTTDDDGTQHLRAQHLQSGTLSDPLLSISV